MSTRTARRMTRRPTVVRAHSDWARLAEKTGRAALWGTGITLALLTLGLSLIFAPSRTKTALVAATDPHTRRGLGDALANGAHAYLTHTPPKRYTRTTTRDHPSPAEPSDSPTNQAEPIRSDEPRRPSPGDHPTRTGPLRPDEPDPSHPPRPDQPDPTAPTRPDKPVQSTPGRQTTPHHVDPNPSTAYEPPTTQSEENPTMTTTTTEQPARGSSIDGSTESLTGITRLGESLSTIHEESAAGLEEAAKLTQEAADERKRAAQAALVLNDADGRKLGKDLLGRINAYQELIGQATLLEDEVSNLRAQAKVETEAAAAATAFAEESTKFRNEMADVRSTERFGEFEQAE